MNHRRNPVSTIAVFATALAGALVLFAPDAAASQVRDCSAQPQIFEPHFVWGVAPDDPDGGLVKRAGPGVQWPRIGVLHRFEAQVWLTGQCSQSASGSTWYEIWDYPHATTAWVSGNFLRVAAPAPVPYFGPVPVPVPNFGPPPLPPFHRGRHPGLVVCG